MAKVWVHPNYDKSSINYNFAVIRLTESIDFSQTWAIQKICLPQSCSDGCSEYSRAFISGWGSSETNGYTSRYLRGTEVIITDRTQCSSQYPGFTNQMMCAGVSGGGADTCDGDSGGPLVVNDDGFYKICGVASHGLGCGSSSFHGVYS